MDGILPGHAPHRTRRLGPPDIPALQRLFERAADYFEVATGAPPGPDEGERAFVGGPPTKSVSDKQTIGLFDGDDGLVGVLDAIPDFPAPHVCTIGLLLVEPRSRGRGLARALLAAFETWMTGAGTRRFRTAIVARHMAGDAFLRRTGYVPVPAPPEAENGAVRFYEKDASSAS